MPALVAVAPAWGQQAGFRARKARAAGEGGIAVAVAHAWSLCGERVIRFILIQSLFILIQKTRRMGAGCCQRPVGASAVPSPRRGVVLSGALSFDVGL